jgi:hypothetical protein
VAEVVDAISQTRINARVSDISQHGCYLDVINVFATGMIVQLSIQHSNLRLETSATVVYSLPGMGMGLSFRPLSGPMQSVLSRWVSELKGDSAADEGAPGESHTPQDYRRLERHILGKLIGLMTRKNMLSHDEGTELLEELLRGE